MSVGDRSGELLGELNSNPSWLIKESAIETDRLVGVLQAPLPRKVSKYLMILAGAALNGAGPHRFTPNLLLSPPYLPFNSRIEG